MLWLKLEDIYQYVDNHSPITPTSTRMPEIDIAMERPEQLSNKFESSILGPDCILTPFILYYSVTENEIVQKTYSDIGDR